MTSSIDPVITIYNLLNNLTNWTETNPSLSQLTFISAPNVTPMPEPPIIAIYRPKSAAEARFVRAPWRVLYLPITIGSQPRYIPTMPIKIDVLAKQNASNNNDITKAMSQKWNALMQIQNIIVANAYQASTNMPFMDLDSWWDDDNYDTTPPLLQCGIIVRAILTQVGN